MAFDYKKEYKEFYLPPKTPGIVDVPEARYIAVRGRGDPNGADGEYQRAVGILYGLAFTIKMSPRAGHAIEGYFDYVVPPLEGFWWQEGVDGVDYRDKAGFQWLACVRLPDFVGEADFQWARAEATRKKKSDFSAAELFVYREGLCVQCLHLGDYDDEPATVRAMHDYAAARGFAPDLTDKRRHHEVYLSDARRVERTKLRTVVRHPIKQI